MRIRGSPVLTRHPEAALFLGLLLLSFSIQLSSSFSLRVASWNLLAQCYVRQSNYPHCDRKSLEWEHRKSLMVQRIFHTEADVFCLQEVQIDLWPDLYRILCREYDGVIQNVTKGHNVGNAILVKKSCGLRLERCESRSRALIGVLSSPSSNDKMLYVCNVHLEAGEQQRDNMQRYYQLKSLFKRLSGQIKMDFKKQVKEERNHLDEASIVVMGDFNMLRNNSLHAFLTQGLLQSPEQLKNLPAFRTIRLADAYVECPAAQELYMDIDEVATAEIATEEENLLQRTFATGFVLDYIWHTPSIQVQKTLLLHPMAKNRSKQKWPSNDYPSDHLPVAADFDFPND